LRRIYSILLARKIAMEAGERGREDERKTNSIIWTEHIEGGHLYGSVRTLSFMRLFEVLAYVLYQKNNTKVYSQLNCDQPGVKFTAVRCCAYVYMCIQIVTVYMALPLRGSWVVSLAVGWAPFNE
jgi:hypothetical protein